MVPVRQVCAILDVSRSWSYAGHATTVAEAEVALRDEIEALVLEFPGYGDRRVTKALQRAGWTVNHKRVLRIRREEAVLCQLKRCWVPTTNSRHGLTTYTNLLQREVMRPSVSLFCGAPRLERPTCRDAFLGCRMRRQ
jgi:transposase InsO family protein